MILAETWKANLNVDEQCLLWQVLQDTVELLRAELLQVKG